MQVSQIPFNLRSAIRAYLKVNDDTPVSVKTKGEGDNREIVIKNDDTNATEVLRSTINDFEKIWSDAKTVEEEQSKATPTKNGDCSCSPVSDKNTALWVAGSFLAGGLIAWVIKGIMD